MALLIGEVLRRNAEQRPDAVAATLGSAGLTHRELDRAGNGLALRLRGLGIGRGDRVVSWAGTSLDALQQFCEGRLAAFKKPRRFECVGELPRTAATGQVQRTLLVERILAGS